MSSFATVVALFLIVIFKTCEFQVSSNNTAYTVSVSKAESITDFDLRLLQGFMDVIILKSVEKGGCATGYSLMRYFHRRFHIMVSSGTVYSKLYWLERQGFLEGTSDGKRRVYRLTKRGKDCLTTIRINERHNHAAFFAIFSANE